MHYNYFRSIGEDGRLRLMFETHLSTFPAKAHWVFGLTAYGKVGGGTLSTRRRWTVSFLRFWWSGQAFPPNPLPKLCRWLGRRLPDLDLQDGKTTPTPMFNTRVSIEHFTRTQRTSLRSCDAWSDKRSRTCIELSAGRPTSAGFSLQCSRSCAHRQLVVVFFRYSDGISLSALTIHMSWQRCLARQNRVQGATRRAVAKVQAGHLQIIGEHAVSPHDWEVIGPM